MSEKEEESVHETVLDEGIEKLLSDFVDCEEELSTARAELARATSDFNETKGKLERSVEARAVLLGHSVDRTDVTRGIEKMVAQTKRGYSPWS